MAGMSEPLFELQSKSDGLKETARTILDFPKRLEYDCMVPMSKIAFMPGRIIHTNEFMLLKDVRTKNSRPSVAEQRSSPSSSEKNGQWYSYSDAAEILKNRAAALDRQILCSKVSDGNCSSATLDDVFKAHDAVKKVTSMPSSSTTLSSLTVNKYDDEDHSYANRKSGNNDSGDESDADIGSDTIDGAESVGGIFEIREFIDSEGNEMKNEVVNLQQEMAEMEEKLGSLISMDHPVVGAASTPVAEGLVRDSQDFSALLSSMKKMTSEMHKQPQTKFCDLSSTAKDSARELEILGKLDYLEKEEEEWQRESDAANRIRIREKELQARALPEAGPGGWKKGFFGKSTSNSAKLVSAEPKKSPQPHASSSSSLLRDNSASESNSSNRIYSNKHCQHKDANPTGVVDVTEKSSPIRAEKISSPATHIIDSVAAPVQSRDTVKQKIVPMSKAFTGNVMERFP